MPIMARQPNGEYIEICVIPSWIGGTQHDISEIKLSTDERIFKNWRTYDGTLPVTVEHSKAGFSVAYKIWGNTGGVGVKKTNLAEGEQLLRNASMGSDGTIVTTSSNFAFRLIPVVEGKTYSIVNIYGAEASESSNFYAFFEELPQIGSVAYNEIRYSFKTPSRTFIAPLSGYLATSDYYPMYDEQHLNLIPLEVYEGNASPYYLPIVSAITGLSELQTDTPIYIGRVALGKDEYVDSESGKIYRMVDGALTPTDPPVPLPEIPTFAGETTISYGGETPLERKEVHKDTVAIDGIVWDILGYDHDEVYKEDGTRASHTVTIQTHDCIDNLQFDAREALFAFPDGLAAGSYTFTIKAHTWVSSDVNKSITFTLTQAVPKGGQLVVSQAYNASFTKGNISSYASSSATEPIETVKMNEGDTGTSLGDVTNAIVDNTNSCQMALLGSNRWSTSAIRQYLNSDKAVGTFWEPQTIFDRPPSWVATTAGFLFGADPEFVTVLGKVKKVTALNNVSDDGGSVETDEKVFLISSTEAYMGNEIAGGEGKAYAYYSNYSGRAAADTRSDTNRIKYRAGAAAFWWLRTPTASSAGPVRFVSKQGALNYSNATSTLGIAPACCIILDDIDSNPWLRDHFLKPADPPEPLPEKVEFTYKLGV